MKGASLPTCPSVFGRDPTVPGSASLGQGCGGLATPPVSSVHPRGMPVTAAPLPLIGRTDGKALCSHSISPKLREISGVGASLQWECDPSPPRQLPDPGGNITSPDEPPHLSREGFGSGTMIGCPKHVQIQCPARKKSHFFLLLGLGSSR